MPAYSCPERIMKRAHQPKAAAPSNALAPTAWRAATGQCNSVEGRFPTSDAPNVLRDQVGSRGEHALRPAGHVRCHDDVVERMERLCRGRDDACNRRVAIPDIERSASDSPAGERVVKRILVHDFCTRDVD